MVFRRGLKHYAIAGVGAIFLSGCGMFGSGSVRDCELKGGLAVRANEVIQKRILSSNPYDRFDVLSDVLSIHDIGSAIDIIDGLPDDFASRKIAGYIKIQEFLDEHPAYLEKHEAVAKQLNGYKSTDKVAKK